MTELGYALQGWKSPTQRCHESYERWISSGSVIKRQTHPPWRQHSTFWPPTSPHFPCTVLGGDTLTAGRQARMQPPSSKLHSPRIIDYFSLSFAWFCAADEHFLARARLCDSGHRLATTDAREGNNHESLIISCVAASPCTLHCTRHEVASPLLPARQI